MNVIIPMAGRGSRLRPHTLTTPKPLIPIAGKPIVQRLVEDICEISGDEINEIAFIIGDFGAAVEKDLLEIAESLGAVGKIYHQDQPLGTAHAIWMARDSMDDEVIIAFADTLFKADFELDREKDGAIWVKTVEDPSAFGVVTLNEEGIIKGMVEKPTDFVSDLAIIGVYYLKEGARLRSEIEYLIENNILGKGEFQLTDALENMRKKGAKLVPGKVDDWMDCGNKAVVLQTNKKVLKYQKKKKESLIAADLENDNSLIIEPCFIGKGVHIKNSIIGPHVSIGNNCKIENSLIKDSLIQEHTKIKDVVLDKAMIGNHAEVNLKPHDFNIGDFCTL